MQTSHRKVPAKIESNKFLVVQQSCEQAVHTPLFSYNVLNVFIEVDDKWKNLKLA